VAELGSPHARPRAAWTIAAGVLAIALLAVAVVVNACVAQSLPFAYTI
jgi:hypothetical protein